MNWLATLCMLSFGWQRFFLTMFAGAIGALAMPPFFGLPALFLSIPLLIWMLDGVESQKARKAWFGVSFSLGFAYGLGFFTVALHWIGAAFFVDGGPLLFVMPFAVLALAGTMALFWGVAVRLAYLFWSRSAWRIFALAASLSVAEFVRGHVLTGFPFDLLGYSLTANDMMMQATSLVGVYGLTPLVVMMASTPALIWPDDERTWSVRLAPFFLGLVLLVSQMAYGQWRLSAEAPIPSQDVSLRQGLSLRIVQPAIDQATKWQPSARSFITDQLFSLSQSQVGPNDGGLFEVDLLIWPEAALPYYLTDEPGIFSRFARLLPPNTSLVLGVPRRELFADDSARAYNSIMVVDSEGEIAQTYDKTHLVPVGEFLPFKNLFAQFGLTQFVPGIEGWEHGLSRRVLDVEGLPSFLPLICYEAIFSGDLGTQNGAPEFILNVTNDAWFDGSIGPDQHFHHARVRAVEEGLPMVRAANSGVSGVIDAYGRIVAMAANGEVGVIHATLPGRLDGTLFQTVRHWPFLVFVFLGFALAFIGKRANSDKKSHF